MLDEIFSSKEDAEKGYEFLDIKELQVLKESILFLRGCSFPCLAVNNILKIQETCRYDNRQASCKSFGYLSIFMISSSLRLSFCAAVGIEIRPSRSKSRMVSSFPCTIPCEIP